MVQSLQPLPLQCVARVLNNHNKNNKIKVLVIDFIFILFIRAGQWPWGVQYQKFTYFKERGCCIFIRVMDISSEITPKIIKIIAIGPDKK